MHLRCSRQVQHIMPQRLVNQRCHRQQIGPLAPGPQDAICSAASTHSTATDSQVCRHLAVTHKIIVVTHWETRPHCAHQHALRINQLCF
jgi:hypothetical protein